MNKQIEKLMGVSNLLESEVITEQTKLPPAREGQLRKQLGLDEDERLTDLQVNTIVEKQKKQINDGKEDYAAIVRKLNWQAIMNKNNPEVRRKFRSVMDKLKDWHESKKD